MAFERPLLVRFQDVDFARVVYYPNFFDYTHRVFEDFFEAEVGCSYGVMLQQRKLGFPSVHAEADFTAPFRFGERGRVVMDVLRVSRRSISCRYRFFHEGVGDVHATVKVVNAVVSMDTFTGTDLPDEVKAAFERHLVAP